MTLPDTDIVDVVGATVIANRLPGKPVWMLLVGPSGGGKSEFIISLEKLPNICLMSSLTPATFISGRGKAGLLQRLKPNYTYLLAFKDFTTLLTLRFDIRNEVMAQLREAYDGEVIKRFGNGEDFIWRGKLGLIAGVTSMYHTQWNALGQLGERFLLYKMPSPDPESVAERAMRSAAQDTRMQAELQETMKTLADWPLQTITVPLDARRYVARLCAFVAAMRAVVPRGGPGFDILGPPEIELTGRLGGQFNQFTNGLCLLRGLSEPGQDEMELLGRVAFSSVPPIRLQLARAIGSRSISSRSLATRLRLPKTSIWRACQDMVALDLIAGTEEGYVMTKFSEPFFQRIKAEFIQTEEDLD